MLSSPATSPAESAATALRQESQVPWDSVAIAAHQVLHSLALQHSSRGHQIFTAANVQQLLQPSLDLLSQLQKTQQPVKGSAVSGEGRKGTYKGQHKLAVGKAEGSSLFGWECMAHDSWHQQHSQSRYANVVEVLHVYHAQEA